MLNQGKLQLNKLPMQHEVVFYSTVFCFIGIALGCCGTLVWVSYVQFKNKK